MWVLHGPAGNEKLAAILILLRAPLLLGLSMDAGVFMSGVGWALVAAVSFVLPACPDELSVATSGLSFTGITNKKTCWTTIHKYVPMLDSLSFFYLIARKSLKTFFVKGRTP